MTWEQMKLELWAMVLTGQVRWTVPLGVPMFHRQPYDQESDR